MDDAIAEFIKDNPDAGLTQTTNEIHVRLYWPITSEEFYDLHTLANGRPITMNGSDYCLFVTISKTK
jgi:hypothetical protein